MLLQPDPDYLGLKLERQRALSALLHLAPTPSRLAALIFRETNPMFASRMMASLSELCCGSFQQPPAEWITKMHRYTRRRRRPSRSTYPSACATRW